jgi:CheY-like chemotaxis protein
MVIDDDPAQREMLHDLFTGRGYDVVTAGDGEEGLRLSATRRPDLIILDIVMPGMGGLEVLTALKRQHPRLPVIVRSAGGEEALDRATLAMYSRVQVGAGLLVDKTVSLRQLATAVDDLLDRKQ